MFMGVIGTSPEFEVLRELEGRRVLVTGLTASLGVDVARAFSDVKARLIVHTTDLTPEMTALLALMSQSASEIKLYTNPMDNAGGAVRFAQTAAQAYGGLDAVVNLTSITSAEMAGLSSERDVEDLVTHKLSNIAHMTSVIANRMRVILSEGLILNVLAMAHPRDGREAAVAGIARTALAAMTKGEANVWADQAVRINAVGPRVVGIAKGSSGACITNEPDIAALALYLASRRGKTLSGHVFDAEGAASAGL